MNIKKTIIVAIFFFLLALAGNVIAGVDGTTNTEDLKSNVAYEEYLNDHEQFSTGLDDTEKKTFWEDRYSKQKNGFALEFARKRTEKRLIDSGKTGGASQSKLKEVELSSKDLEWKGNKLGLKDKGGKLIVWVDFDKIPEFVTKTTYDEKTKTMTFWKGESKFKTIKGTLDNKEGHITEEKEKKSGGILGAIGGALGVGGKTEKSAVKLFHQGAESDIEYKDGKYYINKGYLEDGDEFVTNGLDDKNPAEAWYDNNGVLQTRNAKILFTFKNEEGVKQIAATATTTTNLESDIAVFSKNKPIPGDFTGPYVYVNIDESKIYINGVKEDGGNSYVNVKINKEFDEVSGKGSQAWLTNGKSKLQFHNGGIYKDRYVIGDLKKSSSFVHKIGKITNLENLDKIYRWQKDSRGDYILYDINSRYNVQRGQMDLHVTATGQLFGLVSKSQSEALSGTFVDSIPREFRKDLYEPSQKAIEGGSEAIENERLRKIADNPNSKIRIESYRPSDGDMVARKFKGTFEDRFEHGLIQSKEKGYKSLNDAAGKAASLWPYPDETTTIGSLTLRTAEAISGEAPSYADVAGATVYRAYTTEGFKESGEFKKIIDHIASFDKVKRIEFGHNNVIVAGTQRVQRGRYVYDEFVTKPVPNLNPSVAYALKAGSVHELMGGSYQYEDDSVYLTLRQGMAARKGDTSTIEAILRSRIKTDLKTYRKY